MLRPIVLKVFPSCMLGSDDYRSYDNVSAIRLSRTERTERTRNQTATLPSHLRQDAKVIRKQSSLSTLLAQVDRSAQRTESSGGIPDLDNPWRMEGSETARTRTHRDDSHAL